MKSITDLGFVANHGQWDSQAKFRASVPGLDLWVTDSGLVLDYNVLSNQTRAGHVVRVQFSGGEPGTAYGGGQIQGRLNYLVGEPSEWASGVPIHSEAWVKNLGEGIDARYYFGDGVPRYDLVVRPGADPRSIRLNYEGASNLHVGRDGLLRYDTSLGTVTERGLFAYQKAMNGVRQVAAEPVVNADGTVSYRLGAYDSTKPLVIDPAISFTTTLGNLGIGAVGGSALGTDGSAILVGKTTDSAFPHDTGAYQGTNGSTWNGVVSRVNPDGTIAWRTLIGRDIALNAVAVDGDNKPVVAGVVLKSTSLPAATGYAGQQDGVVFRLNSTGDTMEFGRCIGGNLDDGFHAIDLSGGNIYLGGFGSNNFPVSAGSFDSVSKGSQKDGVVYVLDATTLNRVWATYYGANGNNEVRAVQVDSSGRILVGGVTNGAVFPVTGGVYDTTFTGTSEGFVGRLSANGTTNDWCTFVGGWRTETVHSLKDVSGDGVVVVGQTSSNDIPSLNGGYNNAEDGFVVKLDSSGTFVGGRYISGTSNDIIRGLQVDAGGRVLVAGYTNSGTTWFTTANGLFPNRSAGDVTSSYYDSFLVRLNSDTSLIEYGTFLGVSGDDKGYGVLLDGSKAILTGTVGTNLVATGMNLTPALSTLGLSQGSIVGTPGALGEVTGTVTIDSPAFADMTVNLSSSNPAVSVPATVTVLAGSTTGTFTIGSSAVDESVSSDIEASLGAVTSTQTLTVNPVLVSIALDASSLVGNPGRTLGGTITLSQVVNHDVVVNLASSDTSLATVPATATVLAGASDVTFDVSSVKALSEAASVTINQSYGATSNDASLNLLPPDIASVSIAPGSLKSYESATVTVTFNSPVQADGQVLPRSLLYASGPKAGEQVPFTLCIFKGSDNATAGATTHTFEVASRTTLSDQQVLVKVADVSSNTVNILRPRVLSVNLSSTSVAGPTTVYGYVMLDSQAPAGGLTVNLSNTLVTLAQLSNTQVTVAPNQRRANFSLSVMAVGHDRTSDVKARVKTEDPWSVVTLSIKAPTIKLVDVGNGGVGYPGKNISVRFVLTSKARIGGLKIDLEEVGSSYLTFPIDPERLTPGFEVDGDMTVKILNFPISASTPSGTTINCNAILNGVSTPFTITVP